MEFFKLESNGGMGHTSRVEEISEALKVKLQEYVTPDTGKEKILAAEGLECEVFMVKSDTGWQKGKVKVKVVLEFCPDEPTSSTSSNSILDDLRQQ